MDLEGRKSYKSQFGIEPKRRFYDAAQIIKDPPILLFSEIAPELFHFLEPENVHFLMSFNLSKN